MPQDENTTIHSIILNPFQNASQYHPINETIDTSNKEHLYAVDLANQFGADFQLPISRVTAEAIQEIQEKGSTNEPLFISTQQLPNSPQSYTLHSSQESLRQIVADFWREKMEFQLSIPGASESINDSYLRFFLSAPKSCFWEDFTEFSGPGGKELSSVAKYLLGVAKNIPNQDRYNYAVVLHEATHATEVDLGEIVKESEMLKRSALNSTLMVTNNRLTMDGTAEKVAYERFMNDVFKMQVIAETRAIFNELTYDTEDQDKGFSRSRTAFRLLHLLDSLKTRPAGGFCELESSLRNLARGNIFVMTGLAPHQMATVLLILGEEYLDEETGFINTDKILGNNKTGDFGIDMASVTIEVAKKALSAAYKLSDGDPPIELTDSFYSKIEKSLISRSHHLANSSKKMINALNSVSVNGGTNGT